MSTALDIRLDYGPWSADDGDSTDTDTGAATPDSIPSLFPTNQSNHFQAQHIPQWQQNSTLPLSDDFSDPLNHINSEDFREAEMNMASSAGTSQNPSGLSWASSSAEGRNSLNTALSPIRGSGVIDLTESPPEAYARPASAAWDTHPPPRASWREHPAMPASVQGEFLSQVRPEGSPSPQRTEDPPRKRRRVFHDAATGQPSAAVEPSPPIEAIDLTEVRDKSDLLKVASKQQQDAVQAQMRENQGDAPGARTALTTYKCPICMDTPEDATSTVCGHLFCHKCIMETLRFSEVQRREDATTPAAAKSTKGTCPVCRKPLARKDGPGAGRTLVPLEIKLSTRRDVKGKAVVGKDSNPNTDANTNVGVKVKMKAMGGAAGEGVGGGEAVDTSSSGPAISTSTRVTAAAVGPRLAPTPHPPRSPAAMTGFLQPSLPARLIHSDRLQQQHQRELSADMWNDLTTLEHG